jgi:hypothetical protein
MFVLNCVLWLLWLMFYGPFVIDRKHQPRARRNRLLGHGKVSDRS